MTGPAPWPLLAAFDELLSRQDGLRYPHSMNLRIARETGQVRVEADFGSVEREICPDYLSSRDAAAMLEEALAERYGFDMATVCHKDLVCITVRSPQCKPYGMGLPEPAARTRAALEAGWKLGIWPVKR